MRAWRLCPQRHLQFRRRPLFPGTAQGVRLADDQQPAAHRPGACGRQAVRRASAGLPVRPRSLLPGRAGRRLLSHPTAATRWARGCSATRWSTPRCCWPHCWRWCWTLFVGRAADRRQPGDAGGRGASRPQGSPEIAGLAIEPGQDGVVTLNQRLGSAAIRTHLDDWHWNGFTRAATIARSRLTKRARPQTSKSVLRFWYR